MLEIKTLGKLEILFNGKPVTAFVSNKVPALLVYLAATQKPHTRDVLASLFWGEMPEKDAKNNLRQALANIRRVVNPGYIMTDSAIALSPNAAWKLDANVFERQLELKTGNLDAGATEQNILALAGYEGDFLEGLYLREAPGFEEWQLSERLRLRELAIQAVQVLAEHFIDQGRYQEALHYASRLLTFDPWREEAHRMLMVSKARLGQRSAALAQYHVCCKILQEELGVEPAYETRLIYERIKLAQNQPRTNLAELASHLTGREPVLAELETMLKKSGCRLVNITGIGGSGKTTLALALGKRLLDTYVNGVFFLPMGTLPQDAVGETILGNMLLGLEIGLEAGQKPLDSLVSYLEKRELLLVLDNLEHLPAIVPIIIDILSKTRDIKILTTSRDRLRLKQEWVYQLRGLDVAPDVAPNPENFGAFKMFIEQSQQVAPGSKIAAQKQSIQSICKLVDGLPLGIELAAGMTSILDCETIAQEIQKNLGFLSTHHLDTPPRQASLKAVFLSSRDRLIPPHQELFARLAVFKGSFTTAAAQAVAGGTLEGLSSLIAKSLVYRENPSNHILHPVMRQFAEETLREKQLYFETMQSHARYFADLLIEYKEWLKDNRRSEALGAISAHLPDIRQAWRWFLHVEDWETIGIIAHPLYIYFSSVGRLQDGIAELNLVETSAARIPIHIKARVQNRCGVMLWQSGALQEAAKTFGDVLEATRGDPHPKSRFEHCNAQHQAGNVHFLLGNFTQARENLEAALAYWESVNHLDNAANLYNDVAAVLMVLEQTIPAREKYLAGIDLARQGNNQYALGLMLDGLGLLERYEGNFDLSVDYHRQALAIQQAQGNRLNQLYIEHNLSIAYMEQGHLARAQTNLERLLPEAEDVGAQSTLLMAVLRNMAIIASRQGNFEKAQNCLQKSLELANKSSTDLYRLLALSGYGELYARENRVMDALVLSEYALAHPKSDLETRWTARLVLNRLLVDVPEDVRESARKQAQIVTLEGLINARTR